MRTQYLVRWHPDPVGVPTCEAVRKHEAMLLAKYNTQFIVGVTITLAHAVDEEVMLVNVDLHTRSTSIEV